MSSVIVSSIAWVPCGAAKNVPKKAKGDKKKAYQHFLQAMLQIKTKDKKSMKQNEISSASEVENDPLSKYDLDTYDDDATLEDLEPDAEDSKSEFESDDEYDNYDNYCFKIKPNDNLLAVGHIDGDYGAIIVYVYNHDDDEFYSHSEVYTESPPMCIEWIGCNPHSGNAGNFLAVGCLSSEILIWDLDVVGALQPTAILGKSGRNVLLKKRDTMSTNEGSKREIDSDCSDSEHDESELISWSVDGHDKEVVALAWNKTLKNILASSSTDHTVFIWDMFKLNVLHKFKYSGTFQGLAWHLHEPQFLLCGGETGEVCVMDCNTSDYPVLRWKVSGEVQLVTWNPYDPNMFLCSSDSGYVHAFNIHDKVESWKIKCHKNDLTGLTICENETKVLVTGGLDETVKTWSLLEKPKLINILELNLGSIIDVKVCPDHSSIFAVAGDRSSRISINKI